MHCPTCNKTLAAGTKCPKCGKMAVASSSDEIDLMPLEEPKKTSASDFAPPPEAFLPPPPMPGKGKKQAPTLPGEEPPAEEPLRARASAVAPKASPTGKIVGGVIVALLLLVICWRIFRTADKIVLGKDKVETSWMLSAGQAKGENLDISGKIKWTLDVTPTEDTVLVGVIPRNPKEPLTIAALKKLPETYESVKKGETHSMSGEFKTGTYSWVVMNETKKPVRVKVKFKAQP